MQIVWTNSHLEVLYGVKTLLQVGVKTFGTLLPLVAERDIAPGVEATKHNGLRQIFG